MLESKSSPSHHKEQNFGPDIISMGEEILLQLDG